MFLGPNGQLFWYNVSGNKTELSIELVSKFSLPHSKHRWSTAVVLFPHSTNLFICGDRRGSIHLFDKG